MTPKSKESDRRVAIVAAREDGTVVAQNRTARELMKSGLGQPCWEVVGGLPNAHGLPCERGCVGFLIREGLEHARHTKVSFRGRLHRLTCVPLHGHAVCILKAGGSSHPGGVAVPDDTESSRCSGCSPPARPLLTWLCNSAFEESTVRTHVERMRGKLGVSTRAGLVALGFRLGFLE